MTPSLRTAYRAAVTAVLGVSLTLAPITSAQASAWDLLTKVAQYVPGLKDVVNEITAWKPIIQQCAHAGSTTDVVECIEAAASNDDAQQAGIPSWLPSALNIYLDIEHKDWWGLVRDVGETAACSIGQALLDGFDICGAIEELVDLAKDVGSLVGDAVEFFESLGEDIAEAAEDVYCFFFGCDDSGPPPPTPTIVAGGFCKPHGGMTSLTSGGSSPINSATSLPYDISFTCGDGSKCSGKAGGPLNCVDTIAQAAKKKEQEAQNAVDFATQPNHWAVLFVSHEESCLDQGCRTGIETIRDTLLAKWKQQHAADPDFPWKGTMFDRQQADNDANKLTAASTAAAHKAANADFKAWRDLTVAVWSKQCKDGQCTVDVTALGDNMLQQAMSIYNPSTKDTTGTMGYLGGQYEPQFQQRIDQSIVRTNPNAPPWTQLTAAGCTRVNGSTANFVCKPYSAYQACMTFKNAGKVSVCTRPVDVH